MHEAKDGEDALAALPPVEAGAFPPVEAGALDAGLGGILICDRLKKV